RARAPPTRQSQRAGDRGALPPPPPPPTPPPPDRVPPPRPPPPPPPAAIPGQQAGQLAVDPVQDGGAQQQPPNLFWLPVQHLGQQVLRHRPLGPGELGRQPPRVGVPGQRQRGQPQPRRPPLGPRHQRRRVGQVHPGRSEQLSRLGHGEPQVRLADLGQLPPHPQPVQPHPPVIPAA